MKNKKKATSCMCTSMYAFQKECNWLRRPKPHLLSFFPISRIRRCARILLNGCAVSKIRSFPLDVWPMLASFAMQVLSNVVLWAGAC